MYSLFVREGRMDRHEVRLKYSRRDLRGGRCGSPKL